MTSARNVVFVSLVAVATSAWFCSGCSGLHIVRVNRTKVRQDALAEIRQAAEAEDPATRVHAMEALPLALGQRGGVICKQALSDPSPEVRFAAAMAVGDIRYAPAKEKLVRMARWKVEGAEPDARVFCGVVYALHRLGDSGHTSQLGRLLFDRRKHVRASAVVAMGKMREPSAVVPLREAMANELDHGLRLEFTFSLARCGDKRSLRLLEAYTKAQFVDERVIAIQAMAEMRSQLGPSVFASVMETDQSPRVRMAAAGGLARIGRGDRRTFRYCARAAVDPRKLMAKALGGRRQPTQEEVYSLQRLAAMSLGWFRGNEQAVDVLAGLLRSEDDGVRVAAAAGILRALPQRQGGAWGVLRRKAPKASAGPEAKPAAKRRQPKRPKLHTAGAKD